MRCPRHHQRSLRTPLGKCCMYRQTSSALLHNTPIQNKGRITRGSSQSTPISSSCRPCIISIIFRTTLCTPCSSAHDASHARTGKGYRQDPITRRAPALLANRYLCCPAQRQGEGKVNSSGISCPVPDRKKGLMTLELGANHASSLRLEGAPPI